MSEPKYTSLAEKYADVVRQSVEECILCDECVRNCLTFPLTTMKDKAPSEIVHLFSCSDSTKIPIKFYVVLLCKFRNSRIFEPVP